MTPIQSYLGGMQSFLAIKLFKFREKNESSLHKQMEKNLRKMNNKTEKSLSHRLSNRWQILNIYDNLTYYYWGPNFHEAILNHLTSCKFYLADIFTKVHIWLDQNINLSLSSFSMTISWMNRNSLENKIDC